MAQAFVSNDLFFGFLCHVRSLMPAPVPAERPCKRGFDLEAWAPAQDRVCLQRIEAQSLSFVDALARIVRPGRTPPPHDSEFGCDSLNLPLFSITGAEIECGSRFYSTGQKFFRER